MLAAAAWAVAPSPAGATEPVPTAESAEPTEKHLALIKLEIRQESGKIVKNRELVEWNEDARVVVEGQKRHSVALKLMRKDGSSKVNVTLAYDRDGEAIIAPYEFNAKVKKRKVVRIEGGIAIAVTIIPKTIKVERKAPKVDPGEGNDPLAGLD